MDNIRYGGKHVCSLCGTKFESLNDANYCGGDSSGCNKCLCSNQECLKQWTVKRCGGMGFCRYFCSEHTPEQEEYFYPTPQGDVYGKRCIYPDSIKKY